MYVESKEFLDLAKNKSRMTHLDHLSMRLTNAKAGISASGQENSPAKGKKLGIYGYNANNPTDCTSTVL